MQRSVHKARGSAWSIHLLVACCLVMLLVQGRAQQHPDSSAATQYRVDHSASHLLVVTDKSGVFSFAAHRHAVLATKWSAAARLDPRNPSGSKLTVTVPVDGLVIDSREALAVAGFKKGPSADDVRKIQQRMLSAEVLDAARHPTITFELSKLDTVTSGEANAAGQLTIRGQTKPVQGRVRYTAAENGTIRASGSFVFRQTAFGIEPQTVAGGTVRVKDEITVRFQLALIPEGRQR